MIVIPKKIFDSMHPNSINEDAENLGIQKIIPDLIHMDEVERLQWLKKYAEFVGVGSSRMTYVLKDMTALKVSINERGKAQNKQEYLNTIKENGNGKYSCFSKIYDADNTNWEMLQVEVAKPASNKDFEELVSLGSAAETISVPVSLYVSDGKIEKFFNGPEQKHLIDVFANVVQDDFLQETNEIMDLMENGNFIGLTYRILKNKPKIGTEVNLASIYDFFKKYGLQKMIPADLTNEDNWGVLWRDNVKQLVIIDSGFSQDVFERFYS